MQARKTNWPCHRFQHQERSRYWHSRDFRRVGVAELSGLSTEFIDGAHEKSVDDTTFVEKDRGTRRTVTLVAPLNLVQIDYSRPDVC